MTIDLVTVPCLADNYAFLLHDLASGATALVDAPEAEPVLAALAARGWGLDEVWLTHHHHDHVGGLAAILAATGARVTGAAADAARLPALDRAVVPGEVFRFAGQPVEVIDVSGHTVGHVAFYLAGAELVFTGDSLMAAGCGRMFEGNAMDYWAALSRLSDLPGDPLVCSGHEYTTANLRFALSLEPAQPDLILRSKRVAQVRAAQRPSVPSRLSEERLTNPFLRAADPALKAAMGLSEAPAADVFAAIRAAKDKF
ncbi:MAG: hydroxyacylglutathione hydrolase [Gemmobacter sp.]